MNAVQRLAQRHLPQGRGLAEPVWARRHRGLVRLLEVQGAALAVLALVRGVGLVHMLVDLTPILVAVAASRSATLSIRTRSSACALGLVLCSAGLVHLAGGYIEAHFHFFVMVGLLSLYQAWAPFLVAAGFTVLHHGVIGVLAPESVYNHSAATANPWLFAGIHGGLLFAASVACLITWRLNEHQALHDGLTGLPNRTLLSERLTAACEDAGNRPVALLFLDLDNFKGFNDNGGHALGDQLLSAVATRLAASVRDHDVVARLGGDEFAILLGDVGDHATAAAAAERIVREMDQPFEIGGRPVRVTASVGVAVHGPVGADAEAMLSHADMAMYVAKQRGRARYEVFDAEMHAAALARLELESEMQDAIAAEQFVLHYQPIRSLDAERQVVGLEALVRWQHPRLGLLPPDRFIPVAEETGLIVALGGLVLRTACRQVAEWNARRPGAPLYLSVNVSQKQLGNGIGEAVGAALAESGLDPKLLVLELTESALVDEPGDIDPLHRIRELGVRIAVDDFGTGYSSFDYLRRLPVDAVKIDRSFVQRLVPGSDDEAVLEAIVSLCDVLGLVVIAEGLEQESEAAVLGSLDVPLGQGYLLGRPVPAYAIELLLVDREAATTPSS